MKKLVEMLANFGKKIALPIALATAIYAAPLAARPTQSLSFPGSSFQLEYQIQNQKKETVAAGPPPNFKFLENELLNPLARYIGEKKKPLTVEITSEIGAQSSRPKPQKDQYSQTYTYYAPSGRTLISGNNLLDKSETEKVAGILNGIEGEKIKSQSELVSQLNEENLSENEKIALLNAFGNFLESKNYNLKDINYHFTPSKVFGAIQNSMQTEKKNPIGVCDQIASYNGEIGKDIGMKIWSLDTNQGSGGHAINIVQTDNGLAILDYGKAFLSKTKNIRELMNFFQKYYGTVTFKNRIKNPENDKPELTILTDDGKNFLSFIGYDPSINPLEKSLLDPRKKQADVRIKTVSNGTEDSEAINIFGFFVKRGTITGNGTSPLVGENLTQLGFEKSFFPTQWSEMTPKTYEPVTIKITPNINAFYGSITQQNLNGPANSPGSILGFSLSLKGATQRPEGLNLGTEIKANLTEEVPFSIYQLNSLPLPKIMSAMENDALLYGESAGVGASYKFQTRGLKMMPYLASEFSFFAMEFNKIALDPRVDELKAGIWLGKTLPNDLSFMLVPYFHLKEGQIGGGADAKIKSKYVELGLSGYALRSTNPFAPNSYSLSVGGRAEFGRGISLDIKESVKMDSYGSGDPSIKDSLKIGVSVKE